MAKDTKFKDRNGKSILEGNTIMSEQGTKFIVGFLEEFGWCIKQINYGSSPGYKGRLFVLKEEMCSSLEIIEDYTKMGKDFCPVCNYTCDTASTIEGEHTPPNPGDVSICLNCGEWLEYASDMALIKMRQETISELDPEQLRQLHQGKKHILQRGPIKKL